MSKTKKAKFSVFGSPEADLQRRNEIELQLGILDTDSQLINIAEVLLLKELEEIEDRLDALYNPKEAKKLAKLEAKYNDIEETIMSFVKKRGVIFNKISKIKHGTKNDLPF